MEDRWFVFSVILTGLSINLVVTELCPLQQNTQAVNFCVESSGEEKYAIYIGNDNAPKYANDHCTCTITAVTLQGQLSVNLKKPSDTSNISFVRQDCSATVISRDSTIRIYLTGVVYVIYQTAASDLIDPICLKLDVLVGPIIGGVCAVSVITISVIIIVGIVRRRKRDIQNPSQTDDDITTENPIYDRDGTPNDETNAHNDTTNNDAGHYSTVKSSDGKYAEPYTRSETNQNANYSKVDKASRNCKDNTSRNTPHNQEHTDPYDCTDVKREIQPFNEYNHLLTVHKHPQDALDDYDRTTIHLAQMNEGHDGDADTYNTAFSH